MTGGGIGLGLCGRDCAYQGLMMRWVGENMILIVIVAFWWTCAEGRWTGAKENEAIKEELDPRKLQGQRSLALWALAFK